MTTTAVPQVPQRAAQVLAALDLEITFHDLYDAVGAPIYHDLASRDTSEIRELLGIVRRIPGPVLELAAGSGRLTLPLLALGRDVTALELSGHMVGLLQEQLAKAPARIGQRCTVIRGDMAAFRFDRTFPLIVLGTTSISLLDDAGRARLYQAVRAHLAPGGRFLLSNVELSTGESDLEHEAVGASGRRYRMFEHWPAGSLTRDVAIFPEPAGSGPITVCTTRISVLPTGLLQRELSAAGLAIRARTALPSTGLRHRDVLLEVEAL
jgi:methylation protein MtfA